MALWERRISIQHKVQYNVYDIGTYFSKCFISLLIRTTVLSTYTHVHICLFNASFPDVFQSCTQGKILLVAKPNVGLNSDAVVVFHCSAILVDSAPPIRHRTSIMEPLPCPEHWSYRPRALRFAGKYSECSKQFALIRPKPEILNVHVGWLARNYIAVVQSWCLSVNNSTSRY